MFSPPPPPLPELNPPVSFFFYQIIDAKNLQILLTGFLEKKTAQFMEHLWTLLLSAQSNPLKVPTELLEEKKREMRERAEKEAIERRKQEQLNDVRRREMESRGGGRGGYGGPNSNSNSRGGGYMGAGGGRERYDDRSRGGPSLGYDARGRGGGGGGYQGGRDSGYNNRGGPPRDDYRVRVPPCLSPSEPH